MCALSIRGLPVVAVACMDAGGWAHSEYCLPEWRSGHVVQKSFETERFASAYADILTYITDRLEHDPQTEQVVDRFRAWAEERYVIPPASPMVLAV